MSDKDAKKPGTRDISDLKARLGLKKKTGDAGRAGVVPPPGARGGPGYVPPPPGVAPPAPQVPDARVDPFGAMNAIAAQGVAQRAPEIIVVNDGKPIEQVHPETKLHRYGKIAGILLVPLVLGFLLGGINYERRRVNTTLDDAKDLYGEFQQLGKNLEDLNIILLSAKDRGPGGQTFSPNDATLVQDLEALNFQVAEDEKLILYHANLYNLDPKLVQDTLVFYSRLKSLATRIKDHVRLTKAQLEKPAPEAYKAIGAEVTFGAIVRQPTADEAQKGVKPVAELVQLGAPVCADGRPTPTGACPEGPASGAQFRADTTAPWSSKALANSGDNADKLFLLKPSGVWSALMSGSKKFLDDLQYYDRLTEIDALTKDLVRDRKDIEDRMNVVAQRSRAFAI